jgi:hypothetical protein
MSCVNPNDSLFKILLKELKNPLLAEIEFDNQEDYKPGVSELFDSIPELESIGTEEQYSQYIDSIFPDSQVKDILKHTTSASVNKFKKGTGRLGEGVYLAAPDYKMYDKAGPNVYRAVVNIFNVKRYDTGQFNIAATNQFPTQDEYSKESQRKLQEQDKAQGVNAYISTAKTGTEYNIFEPEQIHILGTKQDIEGFKKFIGKSLITAPVQVDEDLNSYISNELFKKFGVMVPNVGNENLIDAVAVAAFNNAVAMNNGILPAQYYSGENNAHKFILNKKQLYDLVDKDTSEVYLRDVNLTTGVHEEKLTYSPINEKERDATINSLNDAVKDYRIDEILAEKGYDVNDIISNLEAATTQEELDKIINKLLRMIC